MTDTITLTGLVATEPRHTVTGTALPITSFRLASTQRRYDRAKQEWVDAATNWYTISTFRQLALNTLVSIKKGERVVVSGRLRVRDWDAGGKAGTTIEVDADAIGHDLLFGTSTFTRTLMSSKTASTEAAAMSDEAVSDSEGFPSADPQSGEIPPDYSAPHAESADVTSENTPEGNLLPTPF